MTSKLKKIAAVLMLLAYAVAVYCFSFMPSMTDMTMMSEEMSHSVMAHHETHHASSLSGEINALHHQMDCKNCSASKELLVGAPSVVFNLFDSVMIMATAVFLLMVVPFTPPLSLVASRAPPDYFSIAHFLRQHQTVVLRN